MDRLSQQVEAVQTADACARLKQEHDELLKSLQNKEAELASLWMA